MVSQIVGISLTQNEDIFIDQAITNVVTFCDKIIALDNLSTTNTWQAIERLRKNFPHIETCKINDSRESNVYIAGYAGSDTWICGIGGDEIYGPTGLKRCSRQLLDIYYDNHGVLFDKVIHCVYLDLKRHKVRGYLSPPSRSMTKLFNFSALESWDGLCKSLHGGQKCLGGYLL